MLDELILEGYLFWGILIVSYLFFSVFPAFAVVAFGALVAFGASTFASAAFVAFAAFSILIRLFLLHQFQMSGASQSETFRPNLAAKGHLFLHSIVCI